jgi:DNA-binding GntR family transcriptional regulator
MAGRAAAGQNEGEVSDLGTARLARLGNDSLQERVYQELRRAISSGRYASGEVVTIRGLAEMLGTSPMPVREAVRRLVQDRSLEMLPNRSMRVPVMSSERFLQLTDARAVIEGHAALRAAEAMTDPAFSAIRAANERMGLAIRQLDVTAVVDANREFHFEIYKASGSEVLLSVIDTLWQQSGPYLAVLLRALSATPEALPTVGFGHHFDLLAAFGARNAEAARKAMDDDIRDAADWYVNHGTAAAGQ